MILHTERRQIHRFPIGYQRTIQGEKCTLINYTKAGNPTYRRPSGGTITFRPATRDSERKRDKRWWGRKVRMKEAEAAGVITLGGGSQ